jgi:NADH dehydrogenase FAD-containing subunit
MQSSSIKRLRRIGLLSNKTVARALGNRASGKPRIVVVGAGWAGYRLAHDLSKQRFDVSVVSPRNHFLFTPLLPSTAVGTLEFRAIQEPVRTIPNIFYFQAYVEKINFENGTVLCRDAFKHDQHEFTIPYDAIVLATGSETNTFGVPGVENNENVFFLKQLKDSRNIRNTLIDCFEKASSPGTSPEEVKRLLTFAIVGGGPTSVEFSAELYDFLKKDVSRNYPELRKLCRVVLLEASGHILGQFQETLVSYVEKLFEKRHVEVRTNTAVKAIENGHTAVLSDGTNLDFGLMVWSTGVKQVPFIQHMDPKLLKKIKGGRIAIDDYLRVFSGEEGAVADEKTRKRWKHAVFAMGDCAGDIDQPLPALAQVCKT